MLVWALDRLVSESVNEVFDHIRKLSRYGVYFVSYTEEHFRTDGPAGEFLIPDRCLDRAARANSDFRAHQSRPRKGACGGKAPGETPQSVPLQGSTQTRGRGGR